ncbi:hypothetical protein EDEG_03775 [Edhazardia aedis USNM 41457]|uniref:Uncharacterized protein n=1 Tax=Edhazardia aedis (strain USNM 41457) TaxID=1003232 RepID=J9DGH0_EDHAE|nr:hypothetical protein EDEG_03775 [Edhazardia aedis USNM 41457]|eukprot:EJW01695.1 hypothetical protein EDEG_03775 [Edhazardia aedis USNM 41457]
MTPLMSSIIEIQTRLFKDFESPLDFIETYIEVFDIQKHTPYKVFLETVPYHEKFAQQFLNEMFIIIEKYVSHNFDIYEISSYFEKCERIMASFGTKEFFDEDFCNVCVEIYIKGITYLISQIEHKINDILEDETISNDILLKVYKMLYCYCDSDRLIVEGFLISFKAHYTTKIENINIFSSYLLSFKNKMRLFDDLHDLKESKFKYHTLLLRKLLPMNEINTLTISSEKNKSASLKVFDKFSLILNEEIIKYFLNSEPEAAYLKTMNIASELILCGVYQNCFVLEDLKVKASKILDNKEA